VLTHMARVADMRVQSRPRVPVAEWTPEFVDFLQQHHGWLLRLDVAPSTQRVYDASVRRYMSFCEKLGVQAVPDPTWVSQFVLGCTCANFALSTIRVSVAALQRWAADEFGTPGLGHSPLVVRAMKLAARWAVLTTRPKLPLSMGQLQSAVTHLEGLESFVGVRDSAMFQVGWCGMLRASELVGLSWEHLFFPPQGGVLLHILQSKTDPGEGAWVMLAAGRGVVDPVGALLRLRVLAGGAAAQGPIFLVRDGGSKALSKTTVAVRLRKVLQAIGVENGQRMLPTPCVGVVLRTLLLWVLTCATSC
jgi:site-specific recombinase XerC